MELINNILDITFLGFWHFIGMAILLYTILYFIVNGILRIWSNFMEMLIDRKKSNLEKEFPEYWEKYKHLYK